MHTKDTDKAAKCGTNTANTHGAGWEQHYTNTGSKLAGWEGAVQTQAAIQI